jgi:hypothetical protein
MRSSAEALGYTHVNCRCGIELATLAWLSKLSRTVHNECRELSISSTLSPFIPVQILSFCKAPILCICVRKLCLQLCITAHKSQSS